MGFIRVGFQSHSTSRSKHVSSFLDFQTGGREKRSKNAIPHTNLEDLKRFSKHVCDFLYAMTKCHIFYTILKLLSEDCSLVLRKALLICESLLYIPRLIKDSSQNVCPLQLIMWKPRVLQESLTLVTRIRPHFITL